MSVILKHLHHPRSHTEGGTNTDSVNQNMESLRRFDNGDVLLLRDERRRLRNIFINVVDRIRFDDFEERQCMSTRNTIDVIWVE